MLNNEKGSVLIVVLVLMMSILLLLGGIKPSDVANNEYGFGYLQMLLSDFYETHRNYLRVVVINLGEAGVDRAIDKLNSVGTWVAGTEYTEYYDIVNEAVVSNYDTLTDQQRNDNERFWVCYYKATISDTDSASITGIGYVKEMFTNNEFRFNVNKKVTIDATKPVPPALYYGIFSNSTLELKNDITIVGNCHSNDTSLSALEVKATATVTGNVQAVGTATNSGGTVTGTTTSFAATIPFPEVDFDWYENNANYSYTGIKTFSDETLTGIIYVNGNVEIEDTVNLNGVLVATGSIAVLNGATLTHTKLGDYPALMSENGTIDGSIELDGTVTLNSFIYTANTTPDYGKIELKGNVTINSSIISAGTLEIKNTASVIVTSGSQGLPPGFIVDPELTSTWKEEQLTGSEKL